MREKNRTDEVSGDVTRMILLSSPCPTPDELAAWLDGNIDEKTARKIEYHLLGCSECRGIIRTIGKQVEGSQARPRGVNRMLLVGALAASLLLGYFIFPRGSIEKRVQRAISSGNFSVALRELGKWVKCGGSEGSEARQERALEIVLGKPPGNPAGRVPRPVFREKGDEGPILEYPVGPITETRPDFLVRKWSRTLEITVRRINPLSGSERLFTLEVPRGKERVTFPAGQEDLEEGTYYAFLRDDHGISSVSIFQVESGKGWNGARARTDDGPLSQALKIRILAEKGFYADALKGLRDLAKRTGGFAVLEEWKEFLEERICIKSR